MNPRPLVHSAITVGILALGSRAAEAACVITGVRPTATLPTMEAGQQFSFIATADCEKLRFRVPGTPFVAIPKSGPDLGTKDRTYKVVLTEREWNSLVDADDTTFTWSIIGTTSAGVTTRVTTTNELHEDCDLGTDDCVLGYADAQAFVEGDGQWFGHDLAVADANGDKVPDLVVASAFGDRTGTVFVAAGPVSASTTLADLVALDGPAVDSQFGSAVDGGDMNLDEVGDVLAGAWVTGSAYLFLGPVTADRESTDADAILEAASAGSDVDEVDFDADGYPDVAVGACCGDSTHVGAVYVASGPVFAAIDLVADAAWVFDGVHAEDRVGNDVIDAGDMNGDGIHDLALAASSGNGTVFVVDGGMTGGEYRIDLAASVAIEGPDRDSYFGDGLVTTDYDDDGTLDLVVGAFHAARDRGGVWGFLGPLSGTLDVGDADVTWLAGRDSGVAWLGRNMAAGDIDADGSTDLVLGAPLPGSVYLQFGLALGVVEVGTLPSIWGEDGDQLGTAVALVPDWTGDDGAEVFLGVPDRYVSGTFPGAFAVYFSERLY